MVVIGGGPGGYVAAIKAGQLGLKVACVEKHTALGGTCLNVGCIPSKALLNASHMYHDAAHRFSKHGINVQGLSYDLPKMMAAKTKAITGLTQGIAGLFKMNKVDYVQGYGSFADPNTVKVALSKGGEETIKAKHVVIATGSEPAGLPNVVVDEVNIVTSTGALSLAEVPKKMVVIGAGVIGLELGSVYSRLGAEVEVVEFLPRITPGVDAEVASAFQKSLQKQGFKFTLNTKVTKAVNHGKGKGVTLTLEPAAGGEAKEVHADVVLVAIGRKAFTEGLELGKAGVVADKRGMVEINENWQTKTPNVWAIGDVVRGPMLAHKAEEEGIAVIEHIAGKHGHVNYDAIPGVIYTHPEVANVGKTEEELKAAGIVYNKGVFPFMANSRARTNDDAEGFIKVLTDKQSDRILGVHMIGPNVGEMIAEAVLGLEYGASAEDIARTCHAHPTLSEAFKEACMAAYDKPIHFK